MVGVPRSRGCQTCVQRRIKCDTQRPECSQCTKKGFACPGYIKAPKFMDERPLLEKRYGKLPTNPPESIDEQVLPSLVSKSMSEQQPTVFRDFIFTAFPRFFGLNRNRVHVPWMVYVAEQLGKNPALDKSVYCINSVFMGGVHSDDRLKEASKEMYGKALASFRHLMKREDLLRSRETLSSCMLLCMFEAYSQTSQDSWTRHAAGASLLMSMRGPEAHLTGFDRCLYLSFRSFVVAHSFLQGTPCLFEKPEWQALIDRIRSQDISGSRMSPSLRTIVDFSDRLFMEVVKIPGLIYQARQVLLIWPSQQSPKVKRLKSRISVSKEHIEVLTARLQMAVATENYQSTEPRNGLVGPIPLDSPRSFAASILRGTSNCLKILDLLLHSLSYDDDGSHSVVALYDSMGIESTSGATLTPGFRDGESPKTHLEILPFRIVSRTPTEDNDKDNLFPQPEKTGPVEIWLDQVASSLGIGTLDVIVDEPSVTERHAGDTNPSPPVRRQEPWTLDPKLQEREVPSHSTFTELSIVKELG